MREDPSLHSRRRSAGFRREPAPLMSALLPAVTAGILNRSLRARALLWGALVVLLIAALSLLAALTFHYRSSRMQAAVEAHAATAADQLVQVLERNLQAILALPDRATTGSGTSALPAATARR